MKLTAHQAWLMRNRLPDYGWTSRAVRAPTKKDSSAIDALICKGFVESDGEPGEAESIRVTDAGRAALEERGDG